MNELDIIREVATGIRWKYNNEQLYVGIKCDVFWEVHDNLLGRIEATFNPLKKLDQAMNLARQFDLVITKDFVVSRLNTKIKYEHSNNITLCKAICLIIIDIATGNIHKEAQ